MKKTLVASAPSGGGDVAAGRVLNLGDIEKAGWPLSSPNQITISYLIILCASYCNTPQARRTLSITFPIFLDDFQ